MRRLTEDEISFLANIGYSAPDLYLATCVEIDACQDDTPITTLVANAYRNMIATYSASSESYH